MPEARARRKGGVGGIPSRPSVPPERSGGGHWGFSAKWVLTFLKRHHHFRFAKEVASGLRPSALVSAKKFQGVLNSAERIPTESRRFSNEVWIALSTQEPMRREFQKLSV